MLIFFKRQKKILFSSFLTGFILTLFFLFSGDYIASYRQSASGLDKSKEDVLSSSQNSDLLTQSSDMKTLGILFLGMGGAGHDGGNLTDAIQVLFFDFERKKAAIISIPRDLWMKLPNGNEAKINTALISGRKSTAELESGADHVKNAVTTVSGLKIDYLLAVDFVGFQRTIGIDLQGIDVEIGQELTDPWYPIAGQELNTCGKTPQQVADVSQKYSGFELEKQFPCRYERLHFEKGLMHMEGGDALKYVRSRHGSADGDVSRGKRQQEVVTAVAKKLITLNAWDDIPKYYESLTKNITTDIDIDAAKFIGPLLKSYQELKVVNVNLSTANVLASSKSSSGQAIFIPKEGINKWGKTHLFIQEQLN